MMQGQPDEGIAKIRQGIATAQAAEAELRLPHSFAILAEACGEAGQPKEGLMALAEAFDLVSRTGCASSEPELYRLRGELLLMQNNQNPGEAERCFQRAIEIARRQSAKLYELRATTRLARLLAKEGDREEARTTLAEIYHWFTEGFDTADLMDAKALLDELSNSPS